MRRLSINEINVVIAKSDFINLDLEGQSPTELNTQRDIFLYYYDYWIETTRIGFFCPDDELYKVREIQKILDFFILQFCSTIAGLSWKIWVKGDYNVS